MGSGGRSHYHAAKHGVDLIFHPKMSVPLATPASKTVLVFHGSERFVYPQFSHKSDLLYFQAPSIGLYL